MTIDQGDKKFVNDIRTSKACEFINDGCANFIDERYKTLIKKSYYAALNAFQSIIIFEGANPSTEPCNNLLFSRLLCYL